MRMGKANEPSSAEGQKARRFFTQKNHLPRKDVDRIIVKRIGHEFPFDAIQMQEPFAVTNKEGHTSFYIRGSYLLKAASADGGELFGVREDTFKRRYIDY